MSFRDEVPAAPLLLFAENVTALDREGGRVLWTYDPGAEAVRRFAMTVERVYLLDLFCHAACFEQHRDQIYDVIDSWRIDL